MDSTKQLRQQMNQLQQKLNQISNSSSASKQVGSTGKKSKGNSSGNSPLYQSKTAVIVDPRTPALNRGLVQAAITDYFTTGYQPSGDLIPMKALMSKGLSRHGIEWMVNYLDPCGEHSASQALVPDAVPGSRVRKPQIFDQVFGSNQDLGEGATWDMAIMTLPFIEAPYLIVRKKSTSDWPDIAKATWHLNDINADVSIWYLDEYLPSGAYTTKEATHHRLVARGTTTTLTGPLLQHSGEVYSAQFPAEIEWSPARVSVMFPSSGTAEKQPVSVVPSATGQVLFRLPPVDPKKIQVLDRLSRRGRAEEGDYLPLRVSTPMGVPSLRSTLEGGNFVIANVNNTEYNDSEHWYGSTHHLSNPGNDWHVGVTIYMGLQRGEIVSLKMRGYQELAPRADSQLAPMAELVPTPDQAAIKVASLTTHHLRHSYPAAYNDMSGLLGVLGNIFKRVIRPAAGVLAGAGVPFLSPVASVIDKVAGLFGQ